MQVFRHFAKWYMDEDVHRKESALQAVLSEMLRDALRAWVRVSSEHARWTADVRGSLRSTAFNGVHPPKILEQTRSERLTIREQCVCGFVRVAMGSEHPELELRAEAKRFWQSSEVAPPRKRGLGPDCSRGQIPSPYFRSGGPQDVKARMRGGASSAMTNMPDTLVCGAMGAST